MRLLQAAIARMVAIVLILMTPAALFAQQTSDFMPIDPATEAAEQLPAAPMVMGAYALVWLVLIAYVWSLRRRQARVELEMAALRARVNTRPESASHNPPPQHP